jgi:Spy/CpxP family protein refolding chaperone
MGGLMSYRNVIIALGALAAAAPAAAQVDSEPPAAELRARIEERFTARVKEELALNDQQAARLREVAGSWARKRRGYEAEERELKRALASQMRPGVAAQPDSVTKLTQRLMDLRVEYAESYRSEYRELGFLTPVQRAQYVALRERVLDNLRRARQQRMQRGGMGRGPGEGRAGP